MCSISTWGSRLDLLNGGRDGYSHRLEYLATGPLHVAPQQEPLPRLLYLHHLQPVQVRDHVRPLKRVTSLLQTRLEVLTQHQRQERAKHMTPDRFVAPVVVLLYPYNLSSFFNRGMTLRDR